MATYTLVDLRTAVRQASDNVGSLFVTDAELNSYIQRSYNELYGLIVQSYGEEYFVQTPSAGATFVTDGTNSRFALPVDFFKLRGVDLQVQSPNQWVTLRQFAMADRNRLSIFNNPIPMSGQTVRVLYTPLPTLPAIDADTIDGVNGWEEYVIIDAALKVLGKEEADVSVLTGRKRDMLERLKTETDTRNSGAPHRIADTLFGGARGMMYRLDGNNLWLVGNSTPGWGPFGDWGADAAGGWW